MSRNQRDSSARSRGSRRICPNTAGRPRRACTACSRNCRPGTPTDHSRSRRLASSDSPARRSRTPPRRGTPGPARRSNNISLCRRAGALVSVPPSAPPSARSWHLSRDTTTESSLRYFFASNSFESVAECGRAAWLFRVDVVVNCRDLCTGFSLNVTALHRVRCPAGPGSTLVHHVFFTFSSTTRCHQRKHTRLYRRVRTRCDSRGAWDGTVVAATSAFCSPV